MHILIFLLIGLIAGWIATKITWGHSFGLLGNLLVGVVGALIGPSILRLFNLQISGIDPYVAMTLVAVLGAVVLLLLLRLIRRGP